MGRRTFFRYFRSKEDAISPDHQAALARLSEVFSAAHPTEPTVALVLRAGETVFDLYTEDPQVSVRRFRLTHEVPVLRDRESASVDHYRRLFTRHLRHRFAGEEDGELRAAVAGRLLRVGAEYDPEIERTLEPLFEERYTVRFASYPVREPWLLEPARTVAAEPR